MDTMQEFVDQCMLDDSLFQDCNIHEGTVKEGNLESNLEGNLEDNLEGNLEEIVFEHLNIDEIFKDDCSIAETISFDEIIYAKPRYVIYYIVNKHKLIMFVLLHLELN